MGSRWDSKNSPNFERRVSRANECYENEDDYEDFEEKGKCYDCVEQDVAEDDVAQIPPNIESLQVVECSNVHFGSKTYFNGPVTVLKQTIVSPSEVENGKTDNSKGLCPTEGANQTNTINKVCLVLCSRSKKRQLVLTGSVVVATLIVFSIYVAVLMNQNTTRPSASIRSTTVSDTGDGTVSDVFLSSSNGSATFLDGQTLRIKARSEWLAQPPVGETTDLMTPVPFVIITHSATEGCHTTAECIVRVRTIQQFHIESRSWSDIAYHYLIGGDGAVYEGRGWDKVGAVSLGWNFKSIGICVVGTFITIEPTSKQLATTQKLIARGVALGKIATDYKLLAHNQTQSTESPGRLMYAQMKNWPHWYNSTEQLFQT